MQEKRHVTLWEVDIYPVAGERDLAAESIAASAADLGLANDLSVATARGYLLEGPLDEAEAVRRLARELLADEVVERTVIGRLGDAALNTPPAGTALCVHVLPKPGVMDPVALSAENAIADFDIHVRPRADAEEDLVVAARTGSTAGPVQQSAGQRLGRTSRDRPTRFPAAGYGPARRVSADPRADSRTRRSPRSSS